MKYRLNNEEPASTPGSSNVFLVVQSIGFPGVPGLPPLLRSEGTFKILAGPEHPLIILFSVLGMTSLISSSDFITIFLSIELQSFTLYILATAWLTTMPKISLFYFSTLHPSLRDSGYPSLWDGL